MPTDTIHTPRQVQGVRWADLSHRPVKLYHLARCEVGPHSCHLACTSSLLGGAAFSSLLSSFQVQLIACVVLCRVLQVPTAQTGWRRGADMRLLTYSSLQSSTLLKSLLSFLTSHLMAMLLASVTAPPTPQV